MKKPTKKQIQAIKELKPWSPSEFRKGRKYYNGIPVEEVTNIIMKKAKRRRVKYIEDPQFETIKRLIYQAKAAKGTPYFKQLIEGTTGIYWASPIHGHSDYNKSRIFDKTDKNLKRMELINSIICKS